MNARMQQMVHRPRLLIGRLVFAQLRAVARQLTPKTTFHGVENMSRR